MVVSDKSTRLPVLAKFMGRVVEQMRLAVKVLPVVGIVTLGFVVLTVLVWTPLSLEVVHVEVCIVRVHVDESSLDISLGMCERTKLGIGALVSLACGAELGLVLLDVIETFHIAVRHLALVTLLARLLLLVRAEIG